MPNSLQLAEGDPVLLEAVKRARKMLNRRALVGAAAGAVPVPGLDWLVDAALLSRMLPALSAEFGLTAEQVERLPKHKREQVEKAVAVVGSMLVGKFITKELVLRAASMVGMRLTAKQAAKYVPLAGQALSAAIGYTAIRYIGEEHIKDCVKVCKAVHFQLPAPPLEVLQDES
jgi:uncharacterized protein (DUF697 family)